VLAYSPGKQQIGRRAESVRLRCRRLPMLLRCLNSLNLPRDFIPCGKLQWLRLVIY
jgi:hypothetical protein